ncbi:hypothetical protein NEOLEDRAFT_1150656 [Neolentinus lepideus HHB14362 ss-1]|uniref:Uncharacterized protein n=1 Tax=Neolentinus lepideus HHB14362 ss-1 TaxID=1314782 RepID=A0A165PT64_9AGAM|nr:hypothetical protein NEOLEDRAFT_1150656 [Neolentinus lepideus HHB14362 ss-1]
MAVFKRAKNSAETQKKISRSKRSVKQWHSRGEDRPDTRWRTKLKRLYRIEKMIDEILEMPQMHNGQKSTNLNSENLNSEDLVSGDAATSATRCPRPASVNNSLSSDTETLAQSTLVPLSDIGSSCHLPPPPSSSNVPFPTALDNHKHSPVEPKPAVGPGMLDKGALPFARTVAECKWPSLTVECLTVDSSSDEEDFCSEKDASVSDDGIYAIPQKRRRRDSSPRRLPSSRVRGRDIKPKPLRGLGVSSYE